MKHKNSDYSSKKDRYYRGFKQLILFDLIVLKDHILLLHLKLVSQASISSSEMQFSKDSFLFLHSKRAHLECQYTSDFLRLNHPLKYCKR